jgi:4-oxalocrotonate tautomerase
LDGIAFSIRERSIFVLNILHNDQEATSIIPKEQPMPFVNIKITREGATSEQKAVLIKGATQLLVDVLGKNPAMTVVVIEEVEMDNWGVGGETITARRLSGR